MDPLTYNEVRTRPSLEERLESIISGAALMADSSCTRDDRRERIVQECNSVRQALQDLLSEYMNNVSNSQFEFVRKLFEMIICIPILNKIINLCLFKDVYHIFISEKVRKSSFVGKENKRIQTLTLIVSSFGCL